MIGVFGHASLLPAAFPGGDLGRSGGLFVPLIGFAFSQSGGEDEGGGPAGIQGADAVLAELEGVPQHGTVLGDPDAPITVGELAELECPVCAEFSGRIDPRSRAVAGGPR